MTSKVKATLVPSKGLGETVTPINAHKVGVWLYYKLNLQKPPFWDPKTIAEAEVAAHKLVEHLMNFYLPITETAVVPKGLIAKVQRQRRKGRSNETKSA